MLLPRRKREKKYDYILHSSYNEIVTHHMSRQQQGLVTHLTAEKREKTHKLIKLEEETHATKFKSSNSLAQPTLLKTPHFSLKK